MVLFSPHNEIFIVLADIWRECSNLTTALLNEKSWVKEVNRSKLKGQEFVLLVCRVPRPPRRERESHIMAAYNSNVKKSKQIHPRQLIKPLFASAKTNSYNLLNIFSQPLRFPPCYFPIIPRFRTYRQKKRLQLWFSLWKHYRVFV